MKQCTIKDAVTVEGTGLHTGKAVRMTFVPAPVNHGFKFKRVDLPDEPIIPADADNVVSTYRGTTLRAGDAQVSTVEHTLSALVGLGIDNVLIEIDSPEAPIMDGSARVFVEKLLGVGIVEQDAECEIFEVEEPISYIDEVTGSELMVIPSNTYQVTTMIDFNSPVLSHQYASMDSIVDYATEIAPCRTFVFLHELEQLLSKDLIKGGNMDNAIVIADRRMSQEELDRLAEKLGRPSIKVDKEGVLNTISLYFNNEPARHKLLDVIGDIALIGRRIQGKVVAKKPGHTANIQFAKKLKKVFKEQQKAKSRPKYDPDVPPVMDVVAIERMLPHRHPFLLVDKIIELTDTYVVGVKNVTYNEPFFKGHFPGNPVMPGVLQIEAMAQTGGILALSTVPDPENWDTYFLKIENSKFKQRVVPGDTLVFKLELLSPIRRGIVHMQATAYVGSKVVSEGELIAQIVRRS
jgi:UDP-3-O-[3-hydroxymyristoyl] N-acetylglucosamine deacetylase/3-hydroxyacyl-[acyl-carrier-protein] dehydratase